MLKQKTTKINLYFRAAWNQKVYWKVWCVTKPTRLNNPWGRYLEALYFGKPVISIGKYKNL